MSYNILGSANWNLVIAEYVAQKESGLALSTPSFAPESWGSYPSTLHVTNAEGLED